MRQFPVLPVLASRFGLAAVILAIAASCSAAEPPVPDLFLRSKAQFRVGDYARALQTLDQIESLAILPDNAVYREAMRPGVAFYRGACLAALDRPTEAREQFEIYLLRHSRVVLDPSTYPAKIRAAMDEALAVVATRPTHADIFDAEPPPAPYREAARRNADAGDDWTSGPVRALLTSEERARFDGLLGPVSRSEFVTNFWKSRDPRPETPENEFRDEFERRVAFADAHFTDGESRGSLTDRGVTFLLLGPPTYAGRKPLTTGDDRADPAGMSMYSRNDVTSALAGGGSAASNQRWDRMTGPGTKLPSSEANWREIWHYRRDLLPRGVPYQQVDLEFITRKGYGNNILQRDDAALNTLAIARSASKTHS
ncbi:MAG: GWxTD domain-containing protein [Acidobacteriota bacterium]